MQGVFQQVAIQKLSDSTIPNYRYPPMETLLAEQTTANNMIIMLSGITVRIYAKWSECVL